MYISCQKELCIYRPSEVNIYWFWEKQWDKVPPFFLSEHLLIIPTSFVGKHHWSEIQLYHILNSHMYLILKLFSSIELLTFLVLLKLQATYFMLYFCLAWTPFQYPFSGCLCFLFLSWSSSPNWACWYFNWNFL